MVGTDFLTTVAERVKALGFDARLEYPGCVVIPHTEPNREWWFGTANETWSGDLMDANGHVETSTATEVSSESEDADRIAQAIVRAVKNHVVTPRKVVASSTRNCGECLMNDVEIVALDENGKCPRCGADYGRA